MKLSTAIQELLIATRADGRSQTTVETYESRLQPFAEFIGPSVAVSAISAGDIRRYISAMLDCDTLYDDHPYREELSRQLSPHTVNGRVRAVKRLFNWLEEEGAIDVAPTRKIRTPRARRDEPKAISMENVKALLDTTNGGDVSDKRDRAIILLLADTGMRVGGLRGLKLTDIDLVAGRAMSTEKGEKTHAVFFSTQTAAALQAWLEVRPGRASDHVFVGVGTKGNEQLKETAINQMLKRRAKLAGIPAGEIINPHSFRHLFAREFLLAGGDIGLLSRILNHASIDVTLSSYGVFRYSELEAAHKKFSPIARQEREDEK